MLRALVCAAINRRDTQQYLHTAPLVVVFYVVFIVIGMSHHSRDDTTHSAIVLYINLENLFIPKPAEMIFMICALVRPLLRPHQTNTHTQQT